MIELTDNDFRPLTSFELMERWTGTKKDALPEQILTQFRPLTSKKAIELWRYTSRYRDELWSYAFQNIPAPLPDTSSFTSIIRIDANSEGIDRTTNKLMSFSLLEDELVIVAWDAGIALATYWVNFYKYWLDMCFPSSDDVSIYSMSEAWFLQYHHEDQFVFGKIRTDLSAPLIKETSNMSKAPLLHQDEIFRLLQNNEKIAAIKLYQKQTGVVFKDAIEAVEKLSQDMHHQKEY